MAKVTYRRIPSLCIACIEVRHDKHVQVRGGVGACMHPDVLKHAKSRLSWRSPVNLGGASTECIECGLADLVDTKGEKGFMKYFRGPGAACPSHRHN